MKKMLKQVLALASLGLLSATAAAQITNTPHNLTNGGTGPNKTSSTDQICVFCHTPHGSNTAVEAPLWNKGVPTSSTFTTYSTANSSTVDGAVLGVGSVSLACLSCHDGTQAMDSMFNAPGRGAGVGDGTTATSQGYTWTAGGTNIGVTGNALADLGKNLRNDHPIGIEYCGGGVTGTNSTVGGSCKDKDFYGPGAVTTGDKLKTASINSAQVFWVDSGTVAGSRDKGDMILYTRDFSGVNGGSASPSVECASCHDPHQQQRNANEVHFMRVTTTNSSICLACHVK